MTRRQTLALLSLSLLFSAPLCADDHLSWSLTLGKDETISGKHVSHVGFGDNHKYSMADGKTVLTVSMAGEGKPVQLSLRLQESGMICQNRGGLEIETDDGRATFGGTLGCRGPDASPREFDEVPVEGWFEVKQ